MSDNIVKRKKLRSILKDIYFYLNCLNLSSNQFDIYGYGIKTLKNETRKEYFDRITNDVFEELVQNMDKYIEYYNDYNSDSEIFEDGAWNHDKWKTFITLDTLMPDVITRELPYISLHLQNDFNIISELAEPIYEYIFKLKEL